MAAGAHVLGGGKFNAKVVIFLGRPSPDCLWEIGMHFKKLISL